MTQARELDLHPADDVAPDGPRFLRLSDVATTLNISGSQTYALVRSGDLIAIKIGGRGQWRVEASQLEQFIQRMYADTREFVRAHPLSADSEDEAPSED